MAVIPLVPRSASQIIGVVPVDTRDGYGFSLGIGAYRVKALNSASTWYWSDTDGLAPGAMNEVLPGVEVSFTGPQTAIYCKGTEPITLQVTFDSPLSATAPGDVTLTGVQTLTNKRITLRVVAHANLATVTPNADSTDVASIAALSQGTDIANPAGTPTDGQRLEIRLTTAASQALTYGNKFRSTLAYTLPSASIGGGVTERLFFEWTSAASKWDLVGYDSAAAAAGGGLFGSNTIVVSEDGDDAAGAGDPYGAEFLTITAAMAAAAAGDTVVVRSGAYTEAPGVGVSVVETGVRCLCFPAVTITLTNGIWASDGGGAGEMVHDLVGHPSFVLSANTLILKRTGSGTAKCRFQIGEITGVGQGFYCAGGAIDLDIDIVRDVAVHYDFATDTMDVGFIHENSSADSQITARFRTVTLTEAAGSEASTYIFKVERATSKLKATGYRTSGASRIGGLQYLDIDFMDGGASINAVLSTLVLVGGTTWLTCKEIRQLAGVRGCINVSHNSAILHFLAGRALGASGGGEVGHAIIYTDNSVGINLYNGVVLIADAGDAASRCLIANVAVAPLAINAKVMGAIVANKAKAADVTLTVGSITVDTDVA